MKAFLLISIMFLPAVIRSQNAVYRCENGKINLKSTAALEVIEARSGKLRGVIDPAAQSFAWTIEVRYFEGFNSPLQQEHFNENYLESTVYPKATFTGRIIEQVNFQQQGPQTVRAKGKLNIHGVEQERILKCQIENKGGKLFVRSTFTVPVADHNIAIPRIVHQKIAEEIQVSVEAVLTM
jgi:polyisoprenoid-binding protein YceI